MLTRGAVALVVFALALVPGTARSEAAIQGGYVQVVAHPDDDILFMNPDLAESVRAGAPVLTAYLTAGESDVVPAARYAAERQAGARAAFARMAAVPNAWDAEELVVGEGRSAEMYSLRAKPEVRLVFLNLPDDNSPHAVGGKHALSRLWEHVAGNRVETLVPEGSTLTRSSTYDREAVITTLELLFERFDPEVVRTQDPEPDARYQGHWGRYHDHPDHVVTARFADVALARYMSGGRSVRVFYYRDYNIADAPANLSPDVVAIKREIFEQYVQHDALVSTGPPYAEWLNAMRRRWEPSSNWAAVDHFGRLNAAQVLGDGMLIRQWDAGRQSNDTIVDTPGFVPTVGTSVLVPGRHGVLTLVVHSRGTDDIWLLRQRSSGAWSGDWVNLGGPVAPTRSTHVGVPSAVGLPDGRLLITAKNTAGGVSILIRGEGTDTGWRHLGGEGVDDAVTAVVGRDGEVNLFAPTQRGLLHLRRQVSGDFVLTPLPRHPVGRIASARAVSGEAYVAFRAAGPDQGDLVVLGERRGWDVVARVRSPGGAPPGLAIGHDGSPFLVAREAWGSTVLTELPHASPALRRELVGRMVGQPAVTPDGKFVLGSSLDGRIAIHRVGAATS